MGICRSSQLKVADFSYNFLVGSIPKCFSYLPRYFIDFCSLSLHLFLVSFTFHLRYLIFFFLDVDQVSRVIAFKTKMPSGVLLHNVVGDPVYAHC